jgi:dinuclear metal center YbgI/SA1388 family protein
MTAINVAAVIEFLERFAPPALAEEWDNIGLLLGDRHAPVQRMMTCLTVTPESAAEAREAGVQLIVTHHPILFRAARRLTADTPEGQMLLGLAQASVAVYCPHTAFDSAMGGINAQLARRLELREVAPLRPAAGPRQCKLVVFVPDSDLNRVSDAMFAAGAGHIGDYRECSFRLAGTGTFFGLDSTHPTLGQKGRREEVAEWRLEVVCPEGRVEEVVSAMRRAHSYEEPAYDVYPLRPTVMASGGGRVGRLPQPIALAELARTVQSALNAPSVQIVGEPGRQIERVAIACGAGGEFTADAIRAGAEVFLTGELRFHDLLAAQAQGLALLLPGHYATERPGVEELAVRLQEAFPQVEVWASRRERNPVSLVV